MTVRTGAIESLKRDRSASAIRRSLEYYYGDADHDARMDAFYTQFVRPGDLVFDIGAHVGDRIGSFRRLGARVVAVEPQGLCIRAIQEIYSGDPQVTWVEAVCGAREGTTKLYVNSANPTVSTASTNFVGAADHAQGWEHEVWDTEIEVPAVTFDALIGAYGRPAFAKIDVEGFEDAVLAGLSHSVPALSFEFTTIERRVAERCLDRLAALGLDLFNVSLGESMRLAFPEWVPAQDIAAYVRSLPHEANAGDVYCRSLSAPTV